MSRIQVEKRFDSLVKLAGKFQNLDGKDLKTHRKELANLVKFAVEKEGFHREDKDGKVKLWSSEGHYLYKMSEDVLIGVSDGKIHINNWALWKTINGLQEQLQEGY